MIRGMTRGHFDHVAIIVRTAEEGPSNFSVVEAVGKWGVTATTWKDIREEIGVGHFYEKCTFRKLSSERSKSFLRQFDIFLEEAWEHSYGINIQKLTKRESFALTNTDGRKYVSLNRTFFCSELVAKAYKSLGVFDTRLSSANFFPAHFSQTKESEQQGDLRLPFAIGVSLSPLYNIKLS